MTANTMAPGYRAPLRHPVHNAFDDVGPPLWRCSRCHGPGTYASPLDIAPAPDPDGPYSNVFVHRNGCVA